MRFALGVLAAFASVELVALVGVADAVPLKLREAEHREVEDGYYTVTRKKTPAATCHVVKVFLAAEAVSETSTRRFRTCFEGNALEESRDEPYVEMGAELDVPSVVVGLLPRPGWTLSDRSRRASARTVTADRDRVVVYAFAPADPPRTLDVRDVKGEHVAGCRMNLARLTVRCRPAFLNA